MTRSSPFVPITLAFVAGVWLASQFPIPLWLSGLVTVLGIVIALLARQANPWAHGSTDALWTAAIVSLVALGVARYTLSAPIPAANSIARFNGQTVTFEGVIADEPDVRPTFAYVRVQPRRLVSGATSTTQLEDMVLMRADSGIRLHYGDAVHAAGRLESPPRMSTFDYRDYLARQGVYAWISRPDQLSVISEGWGDPLYTWLLDIKDAMRKTVQHILPAPESALLNGILIGNDNDMPEPLKEAFRRTGTSHIVAISGFNVSIVITLIVLLLGRLLNPRRAAFFALLAIGIYTIFVGMSASVVRASVMAGIGLIGLLFWRKGFTLNTLCAAALIMLVLNPNTLFDVGFQLSFMATLGLVLYAGRFSNRTRVWVESRISNPRAQHIVLLIADVILVTLAAQVTTLPLILTTYSQFSTVFLLANALVLPLQPPIMILGGLAAVAGLISLPVGSIAAWPVYAFLTLTIRIIEALSGLRFASLAVYDFSTAAAIAYYAALIIISLIALQPVRVRGGMVMALRSRTAGAFMAIGGLTLLIAGAIFWFQRPDGKLHLTFTGGSAFAHSPQGHQIVFASGGNLLPVMGRGMPIWDREVELLILPRRDDFARRDALPLLQRYRVDTLVMPAGTDEPSEILDEWTQAVQTNVDHVVTVTARTTIEFEPGMQVRFDVGRPNRGAQQIAARMTRGDARIDLVGDAGLGPDMHDSDLVFISPRELARPRLNETRPHWVVWADVGGAARELDRSIKVISLREVGEATFVASEQNVTLK